MSWGQVVDFGWNVYVNRYWILMGAVAASIPWYFLAGEKRVDELEDRADMWLLKVAETMARTIMRLISRH